jgi:hypothetical protein
MWRTSVYRYAHYLVNGAEQNMGKTSRCVFLTTVFTALIHTTAAGQLLPGAFSGNPTPGVDQPASPVLADRITVTGCVTRIGERPSDPNSYSEERFALTNAKKEARGPIGSGRSAAATAPLAPRYRLAAIDTFLAPFVGNRVELSGEIINPTTGTGPTLRVEFIQRLAATCR